MSPSDAPAFRRILVIQTASIGDVILATPVTEKLHAFYPDAAIDLLVKKGHESLFEQHPFLHDILIWDKRSGKYRDLYRLLKLIRQNRYDLVVNIQRFSATGLLTACSGARMTIGFDKNPFSRLFTRRIPHVISPCVHEVDRNLELVRDLTDDSRQKPRLYPTPNPYPKREGKGVGYTISPASLWFTKQYPKERWIELVKRIDPGARVYLLGSQADVSLCDEIARTSGHPGVENLAGKLTFLQSAALMKQCRMNFTNDSAPMHLASAVDAPVTVVYCSTIPEFGFGPLSSDAKVVQVPEPLYCRPCGLHGRTACPESHFRCALDIPLAELTARL